MLPEIQSITNTVPFYNAKRVIVCENMGFFKNKFEKIPSFLENIPKYAHIIFIERDINKASRAYKIADKLGLCEEYNIPDNHTLHLWVKNKINESGLTINKTNIDEFINRTDINMYNMSHELDKLIAYCMNKNHIELKDIENITVLNFEEYIFNIVNAIGKRNKKDTLREYGYLYSLSVNSRKILSLLINNFSKLLFIRIGLDTKLSKNEISKKLDIKSSYFLDKSIEQAKLFSRASLFEILDLGGDIQKQMNTGLLDEKTGTELFIIKSLSI